MTSKSQSQIYLDTITKAEAVVLEDNAEKLTERTENERQARHAQSQLDTFKAAQNAIEQAWHDGNADADVTEWQTADVQAKKWATVAAGYEQRANVTLTHTDDELADRVADVLRDYFNGAVEVGSSFTKTEAPEKASALPVAVATQLRPNRYDENGFIVSSGGSEQLDVTYYRTSIMAKLDGERIAKLAKENHGIELELRSSRDRQLANGAVAEEWHAKINRCDPMTAPPIPYTPDQQAVEGGIERNVWPTFYSAFLRKLDGAAVDLHQAKGWASLQTTGALESSSIDGDTWTGTVTYAAVLERRDGKWDDRVYQGERVKYRDWNYDGEALSEAERKAVDDFTASDVVGSLIPEVGLIVGASNVGAREFYDGDGDQSKGTQRRYVALSATVQVSCKPGDLDQQDLDQDGDGPLMSLEQYERAEGLALT